MGEDACADGEEQHVCLCRLLKVNPFQKRCGHVHLFVRVVDLQPSHAPPAPRPYFLLGQFIHLSLGDEFQQWHGRGRGGEVSDPFRKETQQTQHRLQICFAFAVFL